jgi:hypothetical protein
MLTGIGDPGWYLYEDVPIGRRYPGGEMFMASGGVEAVDVRDEDTAPEDPQTQFEGAIDAALTAELMSEQDVTWLRELARLCGEPPVSLQATEERTAALERLIDERLEQVTTEDPRVPDMRFHLALDTAAALGLLDADGRRRHEDRLEQIYAEMYAEVAVDHHDSGAEPLRGFKGVVAADPMEQNGRRLIAVECFDGGLVVRSETKYELPAELRGRPTGEVYDRFRPPDDSFELELADDVGTRYRPEGGGGSSTVTASHWVSLWCSRVRPGLPLGARVLSVSLDGEIFEVDVTGIAERPGA